MLKRNTFYGGIMDARTISTYYPVNNNYPDFGGFVFQLMIADPTKPNDDFSLTVYAVDLNGTILHNATPYDLPIYRSNPVVVEREIRFANMPLGLDTLKQLYPDGKVSDMTIYPTRYNDNGYVDYDIDVETYTQTGVGKITVPLNPSPPA